MNNTLQKTFQNTANKNFYNVSYSSFLSCWKIIQKKNQYFGIIIPQEHPSYYRFYLHSPIKDSKGWLYDESLTHLIFEEKYYFTIFNRQKLQNFVEPIYKQKLKESGVNILNKKQNVFPYKVYGSKNGFDLYFYLDKNLVLREVKHLVWEK